MKNILKNIKYFLKVKVFIKAKLIVISLFLLTSTIVFNSMYKTLLDDIITHRTDILNIQRNIIKTEKRTINFILNDQGSLVNEKILYKDYKKKIENYREIFGSDSTIDSLFKLKLEYKYKYQNLKINYPNKKDVDVVFNKKLIFGNPENHYKLNLDDYIDEFKRSVNSLNEGQNKIIKLNTKVNKKILLILHTKSLLLEKKGNNKVNLLEERIDNIIFDLRVLSVVHISVILFLLILMYIDFGKLIRRDKNSKNFINTLLYKNINNDNDNDKKI